MDAIATDALTKHYPVGFSGRRRHVALDHLTLRVGQGQVFGFLGPNGAGKTTTLKLLLQLIYPTSGTASILGRPAGSVDVRRRIGYLPEQPYFYDHLTPEELLDYFGGLFGYDAAERRRRTARLLDEVGVGEARRRQLRTFSKGMLQRVGVAQALLNDPEVVFLDEPMSGLDPLGRREIRHLILGLRDRGCTVFFSSHVLADAEALCSRVGILVAGRLVTEGPLTEILAFEVRGWELVVHGLTDAALEHARGAGRVRRATAIGGDRWALDLAPDVAPEVLLADLAVRGASLVSLNPLRDTLEDYFVRQVTAAEASGDDAPAGAGE